MTHLQANRFRQACAKALRIIRKGNAPVYFSVYGIIFWRGDWLDFTK
jgi:hypothetical protein